MKAVVIVTIAAAARYTRLVAVAAPLLANCQLMFLVSSSGEMITCTTIIRAVKRHFAKLHSAHL